MINKLLSVLLILFSFGVVHAEGSQMVTDVQESAQWVSNALTQSGYKADFSLNSLKDIDRFFEDNSKNGEAIPGGLLSEDLGSRLFAIGAYIGEVIKRNGNGQWHITDNSPQAEIKVELRLPDGTKLWPVQRAMKRYANGSEDSIFVYGMDLLQNGSYTIKADENLAAPDSLNAAGVNQVSTEMFEAAMDQLPNLKMELGRLVTTEELKSIKKEHNHFGLTVFRNSIFAQYGRKFKRPWLQRHFEKQSWYVPNVNFSVNKMSKVDMKNVEVINEFESKSKGPGIPPFYTLEMVLYEGFCENRKADYTERFIFDGHNRLVYEKETSGNNVKLLDKREGLWSINEDKVWYRFNSGGTENHLRPVIGLHKCAPVRNI